MWTAASALADPPREEWVWSHADLHGGNVLVKPTGQPLLIDYGDVGPGPSPMDPVTLELSLVFHPDSSAASSGWPTTDQCRAWANLDQFVAGCPFESFVRACRDWAFESANVGERVVYAVAYAYALRQLKYPGTDSLKALAIAEAAMATYSAL